MKFAVAPLIDRYALLPSLGHRRGWVVPTQLLVSTGIASMALVEPHQAGWLFAIGLIITLLSSVQDIATDGYAVRHLTRKSRPVGNAVQAGAVALGVIIGGTVALVLFHKIGWRPTILLVAALSLPPPPCDDLDEGQAGDFTKCGRAKAAEPSWFLPAAERVDGSCFCPDLPGERRSGARHGRTLSRR